MPRAPPTCTRCTPVPAHIVQRHGVLGGGGWEGGGRVWRAAASPAAAEALCASAATRVGGARAALWPPTGPDCVPIYLPTYIFEHAPRGRIRCVCRRWGASPPSTAALLAAAQPAGGIGCCRHGVIKRPCHGCMGGEVPLPRYLHPCTRAMLLCSYIGTQIASSFCTCTIRPYMLVAPFALELDAGCSRHHAETCSVAKQTQDCASSGHLSFSPSHALLSLWRPRHAARSMLPAASHCCCWWFFVLARLRRAPAAMGTAAAPLHCCVCCVWPLPLPLHPLRRWPGPFFPAAPPVCINVQHSTAYMLGMPVGMPYYRYLPIYIRVG